MFIASNLVLSFNSTPNGVVQITTFRNIYKYTNPLGSFP